MKKRLVIAGTIFMFLLFFMSVTLFFLHDTGLFVTNHPYVFAIVALVALITDCFLAKVGYNILRKENLDKMGNEDEQYALMNSYGMIDMAIKKAKLNKINKQIEELTAKKDYAAIIAKITKAYPKVKKIPSSLKRTLSDAYLRSGDTDKALEVASALNSEQGDIESRFSLLRALIGAKKFEEGEELFDTILRLHQGEKTMGQGRLFKAHLGVNYLRYSYMCTLIKGKCFDKAMRQLNILSGVYIKEKTTNGTYLFNNGIPFFENFFRAATFLYTALGKDLSSSEMVKKLKEAVDDDGIEFMDEQLYFLQFSKNSILEAINGNRLYS